MNNGTLNISDTPLNTGGDSDRDIFLQLALVISFPLVVLACLYACIFRLDRNRDR